MTTGADNKWMCSICSWAPLLGDTGTGLEIVVIANNSELRSLPASVDEWLPPVQTTRSDGTPGWTREGTINVPAGIVTPGAIVVRKLANGTATSVDYLGEVKLVSATSVFHIPAMSWVSSEHGWRVFFIGTSYLPKDTPPSLTDERQRELEALRGTPETRLERRKGADRIYWYQTYNDLSILNLIRPPLGDSKEFPYPRRLATNRGTRPDGTEVPHSLTEMAWLPYDDSFSFNKQRDFIGDTLNAGLSSAFALIAEAADNQNLSLLNLVPTVLRGAVRFLLGFLPGVEQPIANFEDFADVLAMYKLAASEERGGFDGLLPQNLYPAKVPRGMGPPTPPWARQPHKLPGGAWDFRLADKDAESINTRIAELRVGPVYDSATGGPRAGVRRTRPRSGRPPMPGAVSVVDRLGQDEWNRVVANSGDINTLLYFTVPRVLDGRPDAWHTDEEYGRQMLAGYNPVVITALKELPEAIGSAIRDEHVRGDLQGSTIEKLVSDAATGGKPRLFMVNYWDFSAFWSALDPKKKEQKVQHQGRALFYLRTDASGKDEALIPVAIELAHPDTHKQFPDLPASAGMVYSRWQLAAAPHTLAVWRLAKAVFKSLDSSFHQLDSHFNRTHGALEPFLIALRRQISTMHPVFKLMVPHFRYTLNINRNAREILINAGTIIETSFSAGQYAMRLASVLYGKYWTFAGQALPEDLRGRGMLDPNDKPWLDYPFATDALDIWHQIHSYFEEYLRLYYKNDKDVMTDPELQGWWTEVKDEGHPDLVKFGLRTEEEVWGFTGPIPSVAKLVHVLTTVAWLASGHHAAVNFGQYDYSGTILNASSVVRRPMPAPGDLSYMELIQAAIGPPQERIIMTYLADPFTAVKVMATVQLLSTHADDEQTLDEENEFLVDPPAVAANRAFIAAMQSLDETIQTRNANPANWARYCLEGGPSVPLPYTLLMPSSGAGVTMRGVPYSVSI